ncbi:MAG: hypothetical protein ABI904_12470 [Chloroflexota bacterium]
MNKHYKQSVLKLTSLIVIALISGCGQSTVKDSPKSIVEQCLIISEDTKQLLGKDYGSIIFDREAESIYIYNKLATPYLYEPGTNQKTSINGYGFAVSLDGTMYAYTTDDNLVVVSDKDGTILTTSPTQNDLITRWVNDGLIIETGKTHIFLNPFTGERRELFEDLPNRYISQGLRGLYQDVSFDPTLTRALYFAWDQKNNIYYFSLWDIANNKEIARISQSGFADAGLPVQWSSDSKQAILRVWEGDNMYSFISIHKNGQTETVLRQNASSFSLSPDNKKLAFWLYNNSKKKWEFSVRNLQTKEITNYCLESKYFPITPIWSVDSQNLVLEFIEDSANASVVLVNLNQGLAIQIAKNAKPIGWLK